MFDQCNLPVLPHDEQLYSAVTRTILRSPITSEIAELYKANWVEYQPIYNLVAPKQTTSLTQNRHTQIRTTDD